MKTPAQVKHPEALARLRKQERHARHAKELLTAIRTLAGLVKHAARELPVHDWEPMPGDGLAAKYEDPVEIADVLEQAAAKAAHHMLSQEDCIGHELEKIGAWPYARDAVAAALERPYLEQRRPSGKRHHYEPAPALVNGKVDREVLAQKLKRNARKGRK